MEFILIGLIDAGAPLTTIAVTTFLVNFRHLVLWAAYPLEPSKRIWQRLYFVFCMVDDSFAVIMGMKRPGFSSYLS